MTQASAPSADLSLDDWLTSVQDRIDALYAYGKTPLPAGPEERHLDMDAAIQSADDCGRLLADAQSYLSQAKAQAMLAVLDEYEDLSAKEREFVIKDRVRKIQRLCDGLEVTERTLRSRLFSSMNANRSHP
jgi:hypothetical protein